MGADVVGREPVVLGADVLVEEGPCLARQPVQQAEVLPGGREGVPGAGQAEVGRERRGEQPRQREGQGGGEGFGRGEGQQDGHGEAEGGRDGHEAVESGGVAGRGAFHVARRVPLEQVALAHAQPPQRAQHGVRAVKRLIGQPRQPQEHPQAFLSEGAQHGEAMPFGRHVLGLAQRAAQGVEHGQGEDEGEETQRPRYGRAAQNQPSSSMIVSESGTRLRRRLSRSFQRESTVRGLGSRFPLKARTRRLSHGRSCQSPRIQR